MHSAHWHSSAAATWPARSSAACVRSGWPAGGDHRRRTLGRAARAHRRRAPRRAPARGGRCVAWPRPTSWSGPSSRRRFAEAAAPCAGFVGGALQSERDGRHPQRRDRARDRQRARRARDAQHAGADRPGHRRPVRARRPSARPTARPSSAVLAPTGSLLWLDARGRSRCGDRAVGLRPGLRVLLSRGDDRSRHADGPDAPTRRGAWRRRPLPAPRAGDAVGRIAVPLLRERVTSKGGTTHAAIARWTPARSRPRSSRRCTPRDAGRSRTWRR